MEFSQDRQIPLTTAIVAFFGGAGAQISWLVMLITSICSLPFLKQTDFSWLYLHGPMTTAEATLTGTRETGSSSDGVAIVEYQFRYRHNGIDHSGASYAGAGGATEGETVQIEFPTASPEHARIVGMRTQPFPPLLVLLGILPLSGLVGILFTLRNGLRNFRILRRGVVTVAKIKRTGSTSITINNRPLMEMELEFQTASGKTSSFVTRTSTPEVIEESPSIQVVYDSHDPSRGLVLDLMPDRFRRFLGGDITPQPTALLLLILPALCATIFYFTFR